MGQFRKSTNFLDIDFFIQPLEHASEPRRIYR